MGWIASTTESEVGQADIRAGKAGVAGGSIAVAGRSGNLATPSSLPNEFHIDERGSRMTANGGDGNLGDKSLVISPQGAPQLFLEQDAWGTVRERTGVISC